MTENSPSASSAEKNQATQAVVDRVSSYQESAPEGTVEKELREALSETDLDLADGEVEALVEAIEADDGPVDVATVLGA